MRVEDITQIQTGNLRERLKKEKHKTEITETERESTARKTES